MSLNWAPTSILFFIRTIWGTIFALSSPHWLGAWAGLEINIVSFLPLIMVPTRVGSREAGVKYFVFQRLGSAWLVFASLLSYSLTFRWETADSAVGATLVFCALGMKLGVAPFHFWLPRTIARMDWGARILLATWQKIGPFGLMTCIISPGAAAMLVLLSSCSALVGGIGGLNQTQVRPLLAYSSIVHIGWMLLAFVHHLGVFYLYLAIYLVTNVLAFFMFACEGINAFRHLQGSRALSMHSLLCILSLLSLGGLPPLLGFIPKWRVILVAVHSPYWWGLIFLVMGSLLSLSYYIRLCYSLAFVKGGNMSLSTGQVIAGVFLLVINLAATLLFLMGI